MKKIRNILFALPLALTLIACSDDDIATIPATTNPLDELGAVTGTMANVAEFEEGAGDDALVSKSQLYYDRVAGKLKFTWTKPAADDPKYDEKVDHIGIFAKGNKTTQMDFKLDPEQELSVQATSVTGAFMPKDGGANPISGGTLYYTYFPYKEQNIENGEFTYENVPLSYKKQVQATNEKMALYFTRTIGDNANKFLESEKNAAAHLSNFEYMISDATATAGNHVHFHYTHVGSIVRFYMVCPSQASDNIFYDSLQVYNSQANFTRKATMNLETKVVTPTETSHVMSLAFHPAIDMTCSDKHSSLNDYEKEISHYWKVDDATKGYIMAYMMVSPIRLKELNESSTLYLLGRQAAYYTYDEYKTAKGNNTITEENFNALPKIDRMKIYETSELDAYNEAKGTSLNATQFAALPLSDRMKGYTNKYYRATLSKLNFEAGKHHQWSVANAPADQPITFEEITIQEWKEGVNYTNTDGAGTGDW